MAFVVPGSQRGQALGVIGGGQLGRMFAMAAQQLGFAVCALDPDPASPAAAVADEHLCAAYDDLTALDALADRCAAITTEFENVPAASLERLAQRRPVRPGAAAVAVAQDRVEEKRFIAACGVPVAPHAVIRSAADLDRIDPRLLPGILKTARLGYDGKGQRTVIDSGSARAAWQELGSVACVLEQRLPLALEVSVVVGRSEQGAVVCYPVTENSHRDGILAVSIAPARINPALARQAADAARLIATRLDYVGVLCVEFFVLADGRLVANEMAPRPHNSGHYTINACTASQFELQVRTLAGLPLPDPIQRAPAVMLNLLGDLWSTGAALTDATASGARTPPWDAVLAIPEACLHLYGKHEARPGRKMGHLTLLGDDLAQALESARQAARLLGVPRPL